MCFLQEKCVLISVATLALACLAEPVISQQVTLPLEDYEWLRRSGERPSPARVDPAVPIVLERAEASLVVGERSARLALELTIMIYGEGWQTIPLPPGGNLTAVTLGALEGRLSSEPESETRTLTCRGAGRYEIRLEGVVPAISDPRAARPTRTVLLELPRAGLVTGVIRSDRADDEVVLVSGALPEASDEIGSYPFVGAPGETLEATLLGATSAVARSGLPLRFDASAASMTHVGRSGVDVFSFMALDIVQGEMDGIHVPIASGFEVLSVSSADTSGLGWDVDADGLSIRFAAPVSGRITLEIASTSASVSPDSPEPFEAPLVIPDGAARTHLVAGISVADDGIPILVEQASARLSEDEDRDFLPSALLEGDVSAFVVRDASEPPRFRVEWPEAGVSSALVSQVDRLIVDALVGENGETAFQYWAVVRSSGALSLTLRPPAGFALVASERSGQRVSAGRSADGIEVPLAAGASEQVVYLFGLTTLTPLPTKGSFEIPLPAMTSPVARVEVRAVLPGERRYELVSDALDGSIGRLPREGWTTLDSAPDWFPVPSGYQLVTASFSAMSAEAGSLSILAKAKREKRRWY